MIQTVITNNSLYPNCCNAIHTTEKKIDVLKLKKLLSNLGFSPVSVGTQYIIEELEFLYNNNFTEIKNLSQVYNISAKIHNLQIQNIQWNVESALVIMNKYANVELLKDIFYWYDNYKNITPKYFFNAILDYLNENY